MYWRTWVVISSAGGSPFSARRQRYGRLARQVLVSIVSDATYGTKYVNAASAASGVNTANWGDGVTCWGWAGTNAQARALTQLATQWKSARCWIPWIVVSYDATMFGSDPVLRFDQASQRYLGLWWAHRIRCHLRY